MAGPEVGRSTAMPVEVLIADTQVIRRQALATLLEACPLIRRVHAVPGLDDLLVAVRCERPNIVLIDPALFLPLRPMVDALLRIDPTARLVLYPAIGDEPADHHRVVPLGAGASANELVAAVLGPSPAGAREAEERVVLTPREREVMSLARHGYTVEQTAALAFMSVGTVKTHLSHAYAKLNTHNRASAVAECVRLGLLGEEGRVK